MRHINIFGVTGSIGQNAQDLILSAPGEFDVQAVTANSNVEGLAQSAIALNAKAAVIADVSLYGELKSALAGHDINVMAGDQALIEAASMPCDISLHAIVGFAGLRPLMAAIEQGGYIAIANKEPLVAAGDLVIRAAMKFGATILPVDSEHNAIFQVFDQSNREAIKRIILTASGGPFRGFQRCDLEKVTKEQALKHPNWDMGAKITIDSATLANKALEIMEAQILFAMPPEQIDVVIHPQSVIHSMVEYVDGSVLSQMGASDMRTPLANILSYPKRLQTSGEVLDFKSLKSLDFEAVDNKAFPLLDLAYSSMQKGAYAKIAFNAANEICVEAFLRDRINFVTIMDIVGDVVNAEKDIKLKSLEDILAYDLDIRLKTNDLLTGK